MQKRGALQLSINAIVVLILAITMLGLGLSFIKNIFGKATQEFEEVGGVIHDQLIEQMKETDKIVDLSGAVYEIEPGKKQIVYIAFKNDQSSQKNFTISGVRASSLSGIILTL